MPHADPDPLVPDPPGSFREEARRRPVASVPEARQLTRARAHDLRTLLVRYVRRHLPVRTTPPPPPEQPPRLVGAHARWLPVLRLIPVTLGLLFALSFVLDAVSAATVAGTPVGELLRVLAVSGLIGFVTNWLAITMLFQPRQKRPILGQGLIPAQRERVIFRLAKAVSEELINEEIIKEKIEASGVIPRYRELALTVARGVIEDPDFRRDLKSLTSDYVQTVLASEPVRQRIADFTVEKIEHYAGKGLSGLALKTYRFLNAEDFERRIDTAIAELPHSVDVALDEMDHLLDRVPEKLEAHSDEIEAWATRAVLSMVEKLDVYTMVVENMRAYDDSKLESLLKKTSNEQLNYIKYLGGVLGFVGGLVIWQPLWSLVAFATVGLVVYGLDVFLLRRQEAPAGPDPTA